MQGSEMLVYTCKHESNHVLNASYEALHQQRVKKKVPVRIIHPIKDKNKLPARRNLPLTEVRFSQQNTTSEVSVVGDKVILQHLGKNAHGFIIDDPIFAATFKEMFDKLWKAGKKPTN